SGVPEGRMREKASGSPQQSLVRRVLRAGRTTSTKLQRKPEPSPQPVSRRERGSIPAPSNPYPGRYACMRSGVRRLAACGSKAQLTPEGEGLKPRLRKSIQNPRLQRARNRRQLLAHLRGLIGRQAGVDHHIADQRMRAQELAVDVDAEFREH